MQKWLDQGYGECLLKERANKSLVIDALKHFDGDRYDLDEYVVMPNHVHVIVTPKNNHELSAILHSWKSFTATEINKHCGRSGTFWQKESFDHIVRNPAQLEKIRAYIRSHAGYEDDSRRGFQPLDNSNNFENDNTKRQDAPSTFQDSRRGFQPLDNSRYFKNDNTKRQDAASTITFWQPAAGTFEHWPDHLSQLKILDPSCGIRSFCGSSISNARTDAHGA